MPRLAIPEEGRLDPAALFPDARAARLEIGFGGGEHLVSQAKANPDVGFIGVEPFLEGVAKALDLVQDSGVRNVRLHRGDGRDVLERLPAASLEAVYVLFPDPWPKKRHWKRRVIQADVVDELARVIAPSGLLRVATDVASYVDWTLFLVRRHPAFEWTARGPGDWREDPADHVATRYQEKNIGDIAPTFLNFRRL